MLEERAVSKRIQIKKHAAVEVLGRVVCTWVDMRMADQGLALLVHKKIPR